MLNVFTVLEIKTKTLGENEKMCVVVCFVTVCGKRKAKKTRAKNKRGGKGVRAVCCVLCSALLASVEVKVNNI